MMNTHINDLQEQLARVCAERDALREALGWFLADARFDVAVGGNPIAVEEMILEARARLGDS